MTITTTTRPVTFSHNGQTRKEPAGTEVYATVRRGWVRIRIPGTLYTQDVNADTLDA